MHNLNITMLTLILKNQCNNIRYYIFCISQNGQVHIRHEKFKSINIYKYINYVLPYRMEHGSMAKLTYHLLTAEEQN